MNSRTDLLVQDKRNIPLDRGFGILMTDLGLSPTKILTSIGLPEEWANDEDVYISLKEYYQLWDAIDQASFNTFLPITIAEAITFETLDLPIFASLYGQDFKTAVNRIIEYKTLVTPLIMSTKETHFSFSITIEWPRIGAHIPEVLYISVLTYFTQLAKLSTRSRLTPIAVEYGFGLDNKAINEYTRFFGAKPTKGTQFCLTFSKQDVEKPLLTANESLWRFFEPELKKQLIKAESSKTIFDQVRLALFECLPAGYACLESVSKRLNISSRTLQRQLTHENISFKKVLMETRRHLAIYYLENTELSNSDISFLLGFKEPNSFVRAFKLWTGRSPGFVRASHLKNRRKLAAVS